MPFCLDRSRRSRKWGMINIPIARWWLGEKVIGGTSSAPLWEVKGWCYRFISARKIPPIWTPFNFALRRECHKARYASDLLGSCRVALIRRLFIIACDKVGLTLVGYLQGAYSACGLHMHLRRPGKIPVFVSIRHPLCWHTKYCWGIGRIVWQFAMVVFGGKDGILF